MNRGNGNGCGIDLHTQRHSARLQPVRGDLGVVRFPEPSIQAIKRSDVRLVIASFIVALDCSGALAASPSAQRGFNIARTYCARCHSIDKVTESPLKIAHPFRTLHERYPVTNLEEPLAEGIVTGHPTMPEFRFEPDQIHDFIEFLKTLQ
jgi:cytochrome c